VLIVAGLAFLAAMAAIIWARRAIRAAATPHSRTLRDLLHAVSEGDIQKVPALLRQLDLRLERLERQLNATEDRLVTAIQRIGLTRFNADPELGGNVSFSLALLDGNDDGVIFTSVYRLEDSRVFLREVRGGKTEHDLMPEEARALNMAMDKELQSRRQGRDQGHTHEGTRSEESTV
jgi:hypothetical protein